MDGDDMATSRRIGALFGYAAGSLLATSAYLLSWFTLDPWADSLGFTDLQKICIGAVAGIILVVPYMFVVRPAIAGAVARAYIRSRLHSNRR